MDIWGVDTVHAEAELLSTITNCLKSMNLTENDVVIKVNFHIFCLHISFLSFIYSLILLD